MKKRILSVLLCLCMVAGMLPALTPEAEAKAIGSYGADFEGSAYTSENPFYKTNPSLWGECTWYCWGRAKEKCGIDVPCRGTAKGWYDEAARSDRSDISVGSTPRVNSILVTEGIGWGVSGTGHVRFIEKVEGSTVYYSEANYSPSTQPAKYNEDSFKEGITGFYLNSEQWAEKIVGYIYLGSSTPSQPSTPTYDSVLVDECKDFFAWIPYNPKLAEDTLYLKNHNGNVQTAWKNIKDPRQLWHFVWDNSRSAYKIINMYDGNCMEVLDSVYANERNVRVYKDNGEDAQRWKIIYGADGWYYNFLPYATNVYALDMYSGSKNVTSGVNIQIFKIHREASQTFQIAHIPSEDVDKYLSSNDLGSDFYARIRFNGSYLATSGYTVDSGRSMNVQLTRTSNSTDPKQIWHFIRQSNGTYKIVNAYNNWCLDLYEGRKGILKAQANTDTKAVNVDTWYEDHGEAAQRWYVMQSPGDSTYRIASTIRNASDALYSLDVNNSNTATGTNIEAFPQHEGANQRFYIDILDYVRPSRPAAPTNIDVQASSGGTNISWSAVPSLSVYDQRLYHVIIFDKNERAVFNQTSTTNNIISSIKLVTGENYTIMVRAINTNYSSTSSNYASGYSTTTVTIMPARYQIDLVAGPGGTVSGGGTYQQGYVVSIKATANNGYTFRGWEENGEIVCTTSGWEFYAAEDRTLKAVFEKDTPVVPTYNISVNTTTGGTVSGGGTYQQGTSATVTATPSAGYRFVEWREGGVRANDSASYSFNVTGSRTLTAIFEQIPVIPVYNISVNAEPGGTASGSGTYRQGSTVTVTATPGDGYTFAGWQEDGQTVETSPSFTFQASADRTLTACFTENTPVDPDDPDVPVDPPVPAPTPITITVSASPADGGTVSGGGTYTESATVTVIASANTGYSFVEWQNDDQTTVSTSETYTFTATEDLKLTAVFEQSTPSTPLHTIQVAATSGGTATGGGTYAEDFTVTVTAAASAGYTFEGWEENGETVSTDSSYSFTVDGDRVLTAVFMEDETPAPIQIHTIRVTATPGGTASGGGAYVADDSVTIIAVANSGYHFTEWQDESGTAVSSDASYSFQVTEDGTFVAVFERDDLNPDDPSQSLLYYDVELQAGPEDGGVVTGGGTYRAGQSITVQASANPGYRFLRWTQDGVSVSTEASYTFAVNENKHLAAVFETENCTVTVSASPAEGGTVSGGGTYTEGESVTISAVSNPGYRFVEWQLDGRRVSVTASYTFTAHANQTYTAVFEKAPEQEEPPAPVTYMITFDANGGAVTPTKMTTDGEGKLAELPTPVRDGYAFDGWFTAPDGGNEITAGTVFTEDTTIYAHWTQNVTLPEPTVFTITFDANGGAVTPTKMTTDGEGKLAELPVPVRDGYTFDGWFTAPGGGDEITVDTMFAEDTTVYAHWTQNVTPPEPTVFTITFDANGGAVTPTKMTTDGEGKLAELPTPVRDGCAFDGWFTARNGGNQITANTVFTSDATVYARWTYNGDIFDEDNWYLPVDSTTPTTYRITASDVPGGTVSISPTRAKKGDAVVVTVTPYDGYELTKLTVTDSKGNELKLTDKGNGKYAFTMPGDKVTVNTVFQPVRVPETSWSNPFTDITESAWYYEAVRFVQENGLMSGDVNGIFAPNANLSRAELAQILYNKEGKPAVSGGSAFTDTAAGAWYSDAVTWAAANRIVGGYGNGLFGPDDHITREQLAVMLWRYAGEPTANSDLTFSDAGQISSFAQDAIRWAVENGILNGKGNSILAPKGFATRAEAAQMLKNYLDN